MGDTITEADVRLFTTLARFDAVYHGHFKCNRQKLTELPVLWAYARDLFQTPGFGDTTDFCQIKQHYYVVHTDINPTQIVPGRAGSRGWQSRTSVSSSAAGRSATAHHPVRRRPRRRAGRGRGAGRLKRAPVIGVGLIVLALVVGPGLLAIWLAQPDLLIGLGSATDAPPVCRLARPDARAAHRPLRLRRRHPATASRQARRIVTTTAKIRVRLIGIDAPEMRPEPSASAQRPPTGCGRWPDPGPRCGWRRTRTARTGTGGGCSSSGPRTVRLLNYDWWPRATRRRSGSGRT